MAGTETVFVLGCGSIGLALAAYLANQGRDVVAVRTSRQQSSAERITVRVCDPAARELRVSVRTASLASLTGLSGILVVTAKSYANREIAAALARQETRGPIVVMQNGMGVENAFLEARFPEVHRGILYATSQTLSEYCVLFRLVASSPIGMVRGTRPSLERCVTALTTARFPFHSETEIQREIWKKAIINSAFNSICPLLEIDNGIFHRDSAAAALAEELVDECVILAAAKGVSLSQSDLMGQLMAISEKSDGVAISTLQDIRNGRETEIEFLNLELARLGSSHCPVIPVAKTELLGKLVLIKSKHHTFRHIMKQGHAMTQSFIPRLHPGTEPCG